MNKFNKQTCLNVKQCFISERIVTKIGTWNVKIAFSTGKLAQIISDIKTNSWHILGIVDWEAIAKLWTTYERRSERRSDSIIFWRWQTTEISQDTFYNQLSAVMDKVLRYDLRILMGDFNAQVRSWHKWFWKYGQKAFEHRTVNGDRLLSLCSSNSLKIGGSMIAHKRIHKGLTKVL